MIPRQTWLLVHRYVGLVMAFFLLVAGLTGSLLAFYEELDTASNWLFTLHMARIGGLLFQIFISVMGIVVALLSITGVIIWRKKHASRHVWKRRQSGISYTNRSSESATTTVAKHLPL